MLIASIVGFLVVLPSLVMMARAGWAVMQRKWWSAVILLALSSIGPLTLVRHWTALGPSALVRWSYLDQPLDANDPDVRTHLDDLLTRLQGGWGRGGGFRRDRRRRLRSVRADRVALRGHAVYYLVGRGGSRSKPRPRAGRRSPMAPFRPWTTWAWDSCLPTKEAGGGSGQRPGTMDPLAGNRRR